MQKARAGLTICISDKFPHEADVMVELSESQC